MKQQCLLRLNLRKVVPANWQLTLLHLLTNVDLFTRIWRLASVQSDTINLYLVVIIIDPLRIIVI